MIRISTEQGQTLRVLDSGAAEQLEFHDRYGFVTPASLERRQRMRRSSGAFVPEDGARFKLSLVQSAGRLKVEPVRDCLVAPDKDRWRIQSNSGVFFIEDAQPETKILPPLQVQTPSRLPLWLGVMAILIPIGIMSWMPATQIENEVKPVEELAPVIIKEAKPPQAVAEKPAPPVDPQAKAKRAVTQNLGFLGLLGKKDFKKAVGGLPTPSAKTTAGAGPGGDAGSGGELVAGMGRGLHKTTVGNTGVSGLGGIGTKGAGGGQGGYGDTSYGSGGGQIISAIPLGNDAKVDSGLDRSQIQATILRYLSQVRACYEEGLKRNQALIGQVTMAFEVGAQGQVNYSNVQRSSLNDGPVENCIKTKMMNWKFPQPRGGVSVKVSYPFMLRPVQS